MDWKSHLKVERLRQKITPRVEESPSPEVIRAREHLGYFIEYVGGLEPQPHHREWINALQSERDTSCLKRIGGKNLNILAPRGSAKSTILAYFAAWSIGHNPHCQIIYCSSSEGIAISRGRVIRRIIESGGYQSVFPSIVPSRIWGDRIWEIDKERAGVSALESDFNCYCVGFSGSIVSRRAHLILIDDGIKNAESIANPKARHQLVNQFHEVLCPTLIPGGRIISVGTRFRLDDIHATEFIESKGWQVIVQKAIAIDGAGVESSYWPSRFSLEYLNDLRNNSEIAFSYQYQNELAKRYSTGFSREWFVKREIPSLFSCLYVGMDFASSLKTQADYSAMVACATHHRYPEKIWVLESVRGKWSGNVEKIQRLFGILNDWQDLLLPTARIKVVAETTGYQSSFKGDLDREIQRLPYGERPPLDFYPSRLKGDKLQRLEGFSARLQRGDVVFNRMQDFTNLVDEACNLGFSSHDDEADALVFALEGATKYRPLEAA